MMNSRRGLILCAMVFLGNTLITKAHQYELPVSDAGITQQAECLIQLESGDLNGRAVPPYIQALSDGEYAKALQNLPDTLPDSDQWMRPYLDGLVRVTTGMVRRESAHFILFTPPGQEFLSTYALPAMEDVANRMNAILKHRPTRKIRIEIYPTKDDFSQASTLDDAALERSGAIGICKFHRLMILSPRGLPLGYRWLDTLSHEYLHLLINEMSHTRMELWLHEGMARYFDTASRMEPPLFLTADARSKLKAAVESEKLISFKRMSPSMVYLKDQEEVSLAFAEVSYAVSLLMTKKGGDGIAEFLTRSSKMGPLPAFEKTYSQTIPEFEIAFKTQLAKENWPMNTGTMTDKIWFGSFNEMDTIGAAAKDKVRMGDRMRVKGMLEAALIQYQEALEEEPDNAVILLKMARVHKALNNIDGATSALKKAIDKNPNYGTPYIDLAHVVSPKDAIPYLLEAVAINPFDPNVHQMLQEDYTKLGMMEKAKEESQISKILQSNPK